MKKDTQDFLTTLLWDAGNNYAEDDENQMDGNFDPRTKSIGDFSEPFVTAVERFIDGFREAVEKAGFEELIARSQRSFGGNVYFSLSGHGCGFFDDRDPDVAEHLDAKIKEFARHGCPFQELAYMLDLDDSGKIDLCFMPDSIDIYRQQIFAIPGDAIDGGQH